MPQAIHRFLYFNDVEIIISLHRCMLLLLPIVDGPPPVRVNAPSKVSGHMDIYTESAGTISKNLETNFVFTLGSCLLVRTTIILNWLVII